MKCEKYELRKTTRGIVFNENNEIAVLNATKVGWYVLPGGRVEGADISTEEALRRECLEEIGAQIVRGGSNPNNLKSSSSFKCQKNIMSVHDSTCTIKVNT